MLNGAVPTFRTSGARTGANCGPTLVCTPPKSMGLEASIFSLVTADSAVAKGASSTSTEPTHPKYSN